MRNYYKFILKSKTQNKYLSYYLILRMFIFRKLSFLDKKYYQKYLAENAKNLNFKEKGEYSQDWFSYNIKYIARVLYKYGLDKKRLDILEIGSYEGLSTVFFLSVLKNSKIDCVDPFMDILFENRDKDFNLVLRNFTNNTELFKDRIKLFKLDSDSYFKKIENKEFDLIYVDGSHHADNVFRDAENSFKYLKKKGFIIFDDFMWNYHKEINLNPIGGIKKFLKKHFNELKIVSIGYQLIIRKI